jgi:hypothetical protein
MNFTDEWKIIILSRYCGEFPPAIDSKNPIKKSSEDIAFDLSCMGEFASDEVSNFLAIHGYQIVFDDDKPVWLLKNNTPDKSLPE